MQKEDIDNFQKVVDKSQKASILWCIIPAIISFIAGWARENFRYG